MPRRSAASYAINTPGVPPPRLKAPSGLNTKEKVVFEAVISSTDPRHWRKSDVPLIVSFVQATLLAHRLGRTNRVKDWEAATRTLLAISTKLRLNPHSRSDPKSIARQKFTPLSAYEQMALDGEDEEEDIPSWKATN
jgi:hypothetical protein